jgi:hypothetical protein
MFHWSVKHYYRGVARSRPIQNGSLSVFRHSGCDKDSVKGCNVMWPGRKFLTFQKKLLPLWSEYSEGEDSKTLWNVCTRLQFKRRHILTDCCLLAGILFVDLWHCREHALRRFSVQWQLLDTSAPLGGRKSRAQLSLLLGKSKYSSTLS